MKTSPRLRAINAVVSALLLVTFVVHGAIGALEMYGVVEGMSAGVTHTLELLAFIHLGIGVYLTIAGLKAQRKSGGEAYAGENLRYLLVRISGIAIAVLMIAHILSFVHDDALHSFSIAHLVINALLVASIAVHVVLNVKPLAMSLGIPTKGSRVVVIALAAALLFMLAAFAVQFLRAGVV